MEGKKAEEVARLYSGIIDNIVKEVRTAAIGPVEMTDILAFQEAYMQFRERLMRIGLRCGELRSEIILAEADAYYGILGDYRSIDYVNAILDWSDPLTIVLTEIRIEDGDVEHTEYHYIYTVSIPTKYLVSADWEAMEKMRISQDAEAFRQIQELEHADRTERERKAYEILKAKFAPEDSE